MMWVGAWVGAFLVSFAVMVSVKALWLAAISLSQLEMAVILFLTVSLVIKVYLDLKKAEKNE